MYYNGAGGYPSDYDRASNPVQIITDIVSIAAYASRMTEQTTHDTVPVYTLQEVTRQIGEGAGSMFHPVLSDIWISMESQLEHYLLNARRTAYNEAFDLLRGTPSEI